ncbi:hypothetical protein LJR296_007260 [Cupriavidus necator]|uniref:hypothetical protein n=1 Tax=Cupriavidus necator TaxID=106590 RepID=UPI003ECE2CD5
MVGVLVVRQAVSDLAQPLPTLELQAEDRLYGEPRLSHQLLDDEGPAITRPVTSQKRVRISHDGRRIVLGFDCGFVEAMVLNRALERRIVSLEEQRLPRWAGWIWKPIWCSPIRSWRWASSSAW